MAEGRGESDGMRIADPRVMRALAHPARIEIVEYLNDTGESVTATQVAGMVGLSPSATSYHLRELAKYGLVEQAPSRGDGRERLWRGKTHSLRIDPDFDEPGSLPATEALVDLYLHRDQARTREWLSRQAQEPAEWRDVSAIMGQRLLVTSEELRQINDKVRELVEPYQMRERQADPPAGARRVTVSYSAIPEV
ncbi:ArsR/SmtB family transcription factor [Paractinoplanes globisporus]|uniref:ArsR/SmtB family transcription factor n=1 Tax=Paractinoplanes globisporus TaxID=113565 RepID=A0ABW6WWW9_9ACTN|nr:winged helix-turn-helix domain-containing protein [Actinoplanes globisporus]